jgi:hypothetical protein
MSPFPQRKIFWKQNIKTLQKMPSPTPQTRASDIKTCV